jgi:protein-S-isoprenylcysteine O-methyltransferase Ste14
MDLSKAVRDPWVWGQLVLIALVGLLAPLLPRFVNLGDADFALNRADPAWIRAIGGVLVIAGAGLAAWGARSLGPSLTPGTEPLPDASLVISGAYSHVRHPIYGGLVLLLAGYTLAWSNWTLALLVGVLARWYFGRKARVEERWLRQHYPAYRAYMVHVRRGVL